MDQMPYRQGQQCAVILACIRNSLKVIFKEIMNIIAGGVSLVLGATYGVRIIIGVTGLILMPTGPSLPSLLSVSS